MNHAQRDAQRARKRIESLRPLGRPATSDFSYSDDELEFIKAVDKFRCDQSIPYPSLTDVLRILKSLGYRKP